MPLVWGGGDFLQAGTEDRTFMGSERGGGGILICATVEGGGGGGGTDRKVCSDTKRCRRGQALRHTKERGGGGLIGAAHDKDDILGF